MFSSILMKIVGSKNERDLKAIAPIVERINGLEPEMSRLSETQLAELTPKFRERLAAGETLDDLLPEAFAAVREISKRILNMGISMSNSSACILPVDMNTFYTALGASESFDAGVAGGVHVARLLPGPVAKDLLARHPCYGGGAARSARRQSALSESASRSGSIRCGGSK